MKNIETNFKMNSRIAKLWKRNRDLAQNHKRDIYVDNAEFLVYHWSGEAATFSPATGDTASAVDDRINIGDHNCRVDIGKPFPYADQMPSKKNGLELTPENFADDYSFFIDHSPIEIYPNELIIGEFHWQLDEARYFQYPEDNQQAGLQARNLGAGGISFTHTCPDLSIGLKLGWGGLLDKINRYQKIHSDNGNLQSAKYLEAAKTVCKSIIRYVERHAKKAEDLAKNEKDPTQKALYEKAAKNCFAIITEPPKTFEQAIQWIQFFQLSERMNGHGNGYGRLDLLLIDYYLNDIKEKRITADEARDLIGELFLKYGGNYFSFGGRDSQLKDATNEVSWLGVEAYDMTGGYNQLGVMWHSDIDIDFWNYSCDVVGRHGCGAPTLVNYEIMRQSELRSGYKEEDCWNISYSGCQWYCAVGKEYNDQDLNSLVLMQPFNRALKESSETAITKWQDFRNIYSRELATTIKALAEFKNNTYLWQPKVWPEIVCSLCMHGPIENGRDVTDIRAVPYNFTSVNVLGVPNVVDAMFAVQKLVFEDKKYDLNQLLTALDVDWVGYEEMRADFLKQEKFGNDLDGVDNLTVEIATEIREMLEETRNIKGFNFRPSLFQFMGHTYAGDLLGASADGRKASEPFAHGMNPQHGRNHEGITATMKSFCKIDFSEYQGGSFQIELNPGFFSKGEKRGDKVQIFADTFFEMGGVQINLNVIDLEKLKGAMDDPTNIEYRDIVVKVTGFSAHFTGMDRRFQEEFLKRVNYNSL